MPTEEQATLDRLNGMFGEPKNQKPYDMGIQGFKRLLKENTHLSRADKNKAVKAYKARITDRLAELKKGLDKDA